MSRSPTVRGINVHAKQLLDGRDRPQLERLCRYITRPPVATERLRHHYDGRIELRLKSTRKDGTRALLLEPHDLLLRLVAAVPTPRSHLLRYFGVLSSHAALRAAVVPALPDEPDQSRHRPTLVQPSDAPIIGRQPFTFAQLLTRLRPKWLRP